MHMLLKAEDEGRGLRFLRPKSGRAQDLINSGTRQCNRIVKFGQRFRLIASVVDQCLEANGGIGHRKRANRAGRSFQRMRQRSRIGGLGREHADKVGRLRRKQRQHFPLEAIIVQRHAPQMREIDRTVIGSERRGWHPVNPFHMKRHGKPKNHLA
jgi:hypothetical protein